MDKIFTAFANTIDTAREKSLIPTPAHKDTSLPISPWAPEPGKKLAIIAVQALFGACRSEDFNEKNTGLVKKLKDNGVEVTLTYLNRTWKDAAQQIKDIVGADRVVEEHSYTFGDLAAHARVAPENVLCIEPDFDNGIQIQREGMTLCNATAIPSRLLMSDAKDELTVQSQKGFEAIQQAVEKFIYS